jgi:hypothetical protein
LFVKKLRTKTGNGNFCICILDSNFIICLRNEAWTQKIWDGFEGYYLITEFHLVANRFCCPSQNLHQNETEHSKPWSNEKNLIFKLESENLPKKWETDLEKISFDPFCCEQAICSRILGLFFLKEIRCEKASVLGETSRHWA